MDYRWGRALWWVFSLLYIDDIFMIWIHGPDNLRVFLSYLTNIYPTMNFTSSHSFTNTLFFDVNVSLTNDGNICADLSWPNLETNCINIYFFLLITLYTQKSHPFRSSIPVTTNLLYRRNLYTHATELTSYLLRTDEDTILTSSLNEDIRTL